MYIHHALNSPPYEGDQVKRGREILSGEGNLWGSVNGTGLSEETLMKKQIIHVTVATALLLSVSTSFAVNAKAQTVTNQEANTKLSQKEIQKLIELEIELQKHGISAEDIQYGIQSNLPQQAQQDSGITTLGVKSTAAKVAAKSMISKLQKIGRVSWDRTVRNYIAKLPISSSAKSTLKKYLAYQFVMSTLNVVIDFSGTIEDAIEKRLKSIGVSSWLAGITARAIVFLLF